LPRAEAPFTSSADTHTLDKEKSASMLETAAKEGVDLPAGATVQDNVDVTAVLLTQGAVRRLFGKEIASTYAVVQLTVSNKSPEAAFVIHSAYIDTSQWALGGGTKGFTISGRAKKGNPRRAGSRPNQISSVESRIARGQLLDAQQWSARNWTVRLLTVAGSVASGYTFAFKETGIAKGIAAFNGSLVPGVAFAWPDGAVAQQNRISDFGYQTNKVVGKESADIIVCFFPIDMFLSAPIRELFLKSPGLFISPYQILFTDRNQAILDALHIPKEKANTLRELHPCYSKIFEVPPEHPIRKQSGKRAAQTAEKIPAGKDSATLLEAAEDAIHSSCLTELKKEANQKDLVLLDYIGRFGLQNIGVYVDGVMTVDVDMVPAAIDQVTFTGDASKPEFWATAGEKKGDLQCRFCQSGQVSIVEADKLGIADVATIAEESTGHNLNFSFKITKAIEPGQMISFLITKKPSDPKKGTQEIKSTPFSYVAAYVVIAAKITDVATKDKKVSVSGSGFFNTKTNPLSVFLLSDADPKKGVPITLPDGQTAEKLTFDLPADLPAGCWNVHVKLKEMETVAPGQPKLKILSAATPKLTEAKRGESSITVKGSQLIDTSECGGSALKFQLLKAGETQAANVTATLTSPTQAVLSLPSEAKTGDWTVQVLQGTEVKSTVKLQ
jgi:hypothetical protein